MFLCGDSFMKLLLLFIHYYPVCARCVCGGMDWGGAHATCTRGNQKIAGCSDFSPSTFTFIPGIEPRSSGLCPKCLLKRIALLNLTSWNFYSSQAKRTINQETFKMHWWEPWVGMSQQTRETYAGSFRYYLIAFPAFGSVEAEDLCTHSKELT